ncbi:F0F1 ATP synthase subunit B [Candidatus Saccharibacteria bacterium]|nr:F0F1 ATP synthase subunit B [Candidatus Saccharibacteria bacterium]
MINTFQQFAATASNETGMMGQLGIDWMTLFMQLAAFLILLFVLSRYAFPALFKVVEDREKQIHESRKMAEEAARKAENAEDEVAKLLSTARKEASDIVSTARNEAASAVAQAEEKSRMKADAIVAAAHEQINKDVLAAKDALRSETLELVALATQKVVSNEFSNALDTKTIERAISEAKQ